MIRATLIAVAALLTTGCTPLGATPPALLTSHTLASAWNGESRTLLCTTGPDSGERASMAMQVIDSSFTQLEAEIQARTEASLNGGPEFQAAQIISLSMQFGDQLAQRIDEDFGCYLAP